MFQLNDDLSIYVTRGDAVYLTIKAKNNGEDYTFRAGEVLRIKVFGKKNCENVVLEKDFPVTSDTTAVDIILEKEDTKFGEVISKPTDYWYEVELNPDTDTPQTIIGYDEGGAKLFKLYPEGADIPAYVPDPEDISVIDDELDMTSDRPVRNRVIAQAFASLKYGYDKVYDAVSSLYVTPQMYGAVGDGEADDSTAIQTAIDSGKPVRVPQGVYRCAKPLEIKRNNVSINSSSEAIEYYGVRFVFDGCDGIHVYGGNRYITIRGIGLYAKSAENDNYAIRFIPKDGKNEVHRFNFEHGFITNFKYGITESADGSKMTLWNCGFRHVRTDTVETAVYLGEYENGNFGVFFEDFFSDNSKLSIKHSKLSFIGCNFGIRQTKIITMEQNVYANFINCNFEYDENLDSKDGTWAIKLNGKEYIFENCQFVLMGDRVAMFTTGTDMYLMHIKGCHSTNKTKGSAPMFTSETAFGRNGAIQFVGSQTVSRPTPANDWYRSGLIANGSSIIKAHDTNDRLYDPHTIRFSGNRGQLEFNNSLDINNPMWLDAFGNSIDSSNYENYPFALGNGFYIEGGEVEVEANKDVFTIPFRIKKDGIVLLETPMVERFTGSPKPAFIFVRDMNPSEGYEYDKNTNNYAVYHCLQWNKEYGDWLAHNGHNGYKVKWIKISTLP